MGKTLALYSQPAAGVSAPLTVYASGLEVLG